MHRDGEIKENTLFVDLPDFIRKQWQFFEQVELEQFIPQIISKEELSAAEKRDLLISYLAHRIGYQWYTRRNTLTTMPLWDLLSRGVFSSLSRHDKRILLYIAESTDDAQEIPSHARTMHPKAALAAIALWRFGHREQRERARRSIVKHGIPQNSKFLYELISCLGDANREAEVPKKKSLLSFIRLLLVNGFTDTAALMGGLRLCKVFAPWRIGSPGVNIHEGCQIAAESFPYESKDWLNLIADAVLQGELRSSWMESVVRGAIRVSLSDPKRADRLRNYHRLKPYEASREQIDELYGFELSRIRKPQKKTVFSKVLSFPLSATRSTCIQKMTHEFDLCLQGNPTRAIHLLERVIEEMESEHIQRILADTLELDPLSERLFRAYVYSFTLDRYAVKFVKANRKDPRVADISERQIENFLVICDYEHTFKNTIVDLAGMKIQHLDKDTAAKVRYFQTSRKEPNSVTKLLARLTGKSDWLFKQLLDSEPIADGIEFVFEQFLDRVSAFNFSEEVMRDLKHQGTLIQHWEEIPMLPIRNIETIIKKNASHRMILAGGAGLLTGGLGPLSFGVSTVIDTPLLMYMAAEVCARYCWYYGFDPRENTDIVAMILGVALKGANLRSVKSDVVRDDLRRVLLYRSLALGALSNGIALQMMSPFLSAFLTPKKKANIKELNLLLPGLSASLTSAINVSFVYDISESARWVLSDRFFARKYEHWNSRF